MVPPCWPTTLGEFRAFGSELGVVCVGGRHEQMDGDEQGIMVLQLAQLVAKWRRYGCTEVE